MKSITGGPSKTLWILKVLIRLLAEYEKSIKLLIEKLVKSDESISKYLEKLKDEIDSKRERKLSLINQPKMVNHISILHMKTPQEKLFHCLHLKEAWSM